MKKLRILLVLTLMAGILLVACDGDGAAEPAEDVAESEQPALEEETVAEPAEAEEEPVVEEEGELVETEEAAEEEEEPTVEATEEPEPVPFTITSTAFENGGEIPERYGYFRDNVSPPLAWEGVPGPTMSLVLVMEDRFFVDDPPVHWIIYNIGGFSSGLPEGIPEALALSDRSMQAPNFNGELGYAGPYPPPGETHEYAFTLYALGSLINPQAIPTQQEVLDVIAGSTIESTEIVGWYVGVTP